MAKRRAVGQQRARRRRAVRRSRVALPARRRHHAALRSRCLRLVECVDERGVLEHLLLQLRPGVLEIRSRRGRATRAPSAACV